MREVCRTILTLCLLILNAVGPILSILDKRCRPHSVDSAQTLLVSFCLIPHKRCRPHSVDSTQTLLGLFVVLHRRSRPLSVSGYMILSSLFILHKCCGLSFCFIIHNINTLLLIPNALGFSLFSGCTTLTPLFVDSTQTPRPHSVSAYTI